MLPVRMPIISPRHVPDSVPYANTPYPNPNTTKFDYPAKEPAKYWWSPDIVMARLAYVLYTYQL